MIWPSCFVETVDRACPEGPTGSTGRLSCFFQRYGYDRIGVHGGAAVFQTTIFGHDRCWETQVTRDLMKARLYARGLFHPLDPLATLPGWLLIRSRDSFVVGGPWGVIMREHKRLFEDSAMARRGSGNYPILAAYHDEVLVGSEPYDVAFICRDAPIRLPNLLLVNRTVVDGGTFMGSEVFVLNVYVATTLAGSLPWQAGNQLRGQEPRPNFDPTVSW